MKLTQQDIAAVVKRAKELGAGNGCDHKQGQFSINQAFGSTDEEKQASLVINAWHEKYDLIYGVQALLERIEERHRQEVKDITTVTLVQTLLDAYKQTHDRQLFVKLWAAAGLAPLSPADASALEDGMGKERFNECLKIWQKGV